MSLAHLPCCKYLTLSLCASQSQAGIGESHSLNSRFHLNFPSTFSPGGVGKAGALPLILWVFEAGSLYVYQTSPALKFPLLLPPNRIIGLYHYVWLNSPLFKLMSSLYTYPSYQVHSASMSVSVSLQCSVTVSPITLVFQGLDNTQKYQPGTL